jgi:hypothetical protein
MRREHSSRCSLGQAGLSTTNNASYPHEDTTTVTGQGGNSTDDPQVKLGKDANRTWESGGEQATKEMKIQECQISAMPRRAALMALDTHLPEIFSA